MKFKFTRSRIFIFAYFLYGLLSLILIYRSKFRIDETIYFSLIDDEMISMRYASNFIHGYGLGWNQSGEKIEGITNLLWTLYMAIFHILPIPSSLTSLCIQLSAVSFLLLSLYFTKKLADFIFGKSFFISITSVLLMVFYIHVLKWGIYGTEVSILTLLTTVGLYYTCLAIKQKRINLLFFVFLGAGTLIRLDFLIVIVVLSFFLYLHLKKKNTLYKGYAIIFFFLISQTFFRISYYGDIVPNTYYLKMTGYPIFLRITNGLYTTFLFMFEMNLILFFIPLITLLKKNKYLPLLFSLFAAQLLYNTYIGGDIGDHREVGSNRFMAIVMPVFFITFSAGVWYIREAILHTYVAINQKLLSFVTFLFLLFSIGSFNVLFHENTYNNFLTHRELGFVPGVKYNVERAIIIDTITTKNARIAVFWAGIAPYFSQRNYIDLLGKSDKVIAHENSNLDLLPTNFEKYIYFNPGHTKWNYTYSVLYLRPDITDFSPNTNLYEITTLGNQKFYLLKNSPNIKWEKVKSLQQNNVQ